jgi:hypothetical protein
MRGEVMAGKSFFYEEKYGVVLTGDETVEDIDKSIAEAEGRPLNVRMFGNMATARGGNVFPTKKYDLDKSVTMAFDRMNKNSRNFL